MVSHLSWFSLYSLISHNKEEMKKKKFSKTSRIARQRSKLRFYPLPLLIIILGIFGLVGIGKIVISSLQNNAVLGTTTLLAKGGDDSGGDSHGGSGSSGSGSSDNSNSGSGSSGSGNSGSGSSGSGSSGDSSSGSSSSGGSVSQNTTVECVGPDGKRFTTSFKSCEDLNKSWGNSNFSFTVKSSENKTETREQRVNPEKSTTHDISPEPLEVQNETGIRTKTEIKQDETRTEVRLSEGERIRTRVKNGETRIDITSGGVKTRLEYKDGRVIIKAEQADGTEVELADDTLLKIDERLAKDDIKIATASGQKFVLQKGVIGAVTDFPLSVDLATNTLTVNTPSGQKNVTVLPDQVVQNLIAANVVSRIGGQAVVDAVRTGSITSVSKVITLGEKNGIPVYEINGLSDQKLLGFIPVAIKKSVAVSAQTGDVVSTQESFSNRILDLLAF